MIKSDKGKLYLNGGSDLVMSEFIHIVIGLKNCLEEYGVDEEEITRTLTGAFFAGMTNDSIEKMLEEDENDN